MWRNYFPKEATMPIIFNEVSGQFEGNIPSTETLPGFDFSVFGGLITNSGTFTGPITADTPENIEVANTLSGSISKAAGSAYAVDLQGNGGRNFYNDGTIFGSARFGNGFDSFFNTGSLNGQIRMGAGNDMLVNQVIPGIDGGPLTLGTITGGVLMGDGDDTVLNGGRLGNVILGAGNDTYNAAILGEETGTGGTAGDVRGGNGNDNLIGGNADDSFQGGAGRDTLDGGAGKDQLYGNGAADLILAGAGNDLVDGGSGNDIIDGGDNNDRLFGGTGADDVYGGNGNDQIWGGSGADVLEGGAGNDKLYGDAQNDTIDGGAGHDLLSGGAGADVFIFNGNSGRDTITDFDSEDVIDLSALQASGVGYADVLENALFSDGDAVIDLSALFNLTSDAIIDRGSLLTVENVTFADLDANAFNLSDFSIIPL